MSYMRYIRVTTHLLLILWSDKTDVLKLCINISYMFHQGNKSHTGDILTLVKLSIVNVSPKQNINTKSSMEVELGVVGDFSQHNIDKIFSK